jgi:hypothetical protein
VHLDPSLVKLGEQGLTTKEERVRRSPRHRHPSKGLPLHFGRDGAADLNLNHSPFTLVTLDFKALFTASSGGCGVVKAYTLNRRAKAHLGSLTNLARLHFDHESIEVIAHPAHRSAVRLIIIGGELITRREGLCGEAMIIDHKTLYFTYTSTFESLSPSAIHLTRDFRVTARLPVEGDRG